MQLIYLLNFGKNTNGSFRFQLPEFFILLPSTTIFQFFIGRLKKQLMFFNNVKSIALTLVFMLYALSTMSAQTSETLATGSFIVNMGVIPQTIGNGLKPYGMVYDLVRNHEVPVKWVINTSKAKDGIDFSHGGTDYKGGTFIIPAEYRTAAVNARITYWQGLGVVGATTVGAISVPVYQTIRIMPRWTLDATNGAIAQGYLNNIGIPTTDYNWKAPSALNCCDDIYVMPHADPAWATHSNLYSWNAGCKGAIWAACHSVSVLENMYNPSSPLQQTNFLMQNGATPGSASVPYTAHSAGSVPYSFANAADPVMQFMGITDAAMLNGSEQIYLPKVGWHPSTRIGGFDPTQANVPGLSPGQAAVIAYGSGLGDDSRGKVMYEGGHSHNKGSINDIAAQRAFMNFSLWAARDKAFDVAMAGIPSTMNGGVGYALSANVTAIIPSGPYTFLWTSSCGGTFTSTTTATTSFTAPTVLSNTSCIIKCRVTDACGRTGFYSQEVTILPGPRPPVATNDAATLPTGCSTTGASLTLNILSNDNDPDGQPITVTALTGNNGTWTNNLNGTVTFVPAENFAGTATASYTICDNTTPTAMCSNATISITVGTADANGCVPGQTFGVSSSDSSTVQTNTTVTNPANALGDPDYDSADNLTYAAIDNNSDILNLDFGSTITTADSIALFFATGTDASSVTATFSYSTNGTAYTTLGTGSVTNILGTVKRFGLPVGGFRYIRIVRTAGTAILRVDAALAEYWDCISSSPVAGNDNAFVSEDDPSVLAVLDNDNSPSGSTLTVKSITSAPTKGKVSINPDNTITYISNNDVSGTDNFTYKVCDADGFCSEGTVTVNISDDGCVAGQYRPLPLGAPTTVTLTAIDDSYLRLDNATTNYGTATTFEVGKSPSRTKRGLLKFDLVTIPSNAIIQSGTMSITLTGGDVVTLSLSAHYLTQPWLESAVTWNKKDASTNWTTAGGTYNTTATATITSDATLVAKNFNISSLVQAWVNGSITNNGLLIKQTNEATLNKRHIYASSEHATTASRPKLTINYVVPLPCAVVPNRTPLANPDVAATSSIMPVTINVTSNDIDPDANSLTVSGIVGAVTGGSASIVSNNILFTPSTTFNGTTTLKYRVCDGSGLCDTADINVTVTNSPPTATNDIVSFNSNTINNTIAVQSNDNDPEGQPMTTTIVTNPKKGSATVSGTNIVYTPATNFYGLDTITYRICEGAVGSCGEPATCVTAQVFITINNRTPVVANDAVSTNACQPILINVLNNDSDPESEALIITSISAVVGGTATINSGGASINFSPTNGFAGNATFNYTVCDQATPALCATATVTVTVGSSPAVNTPPIAGSDIADETLVGQRAIISVLDNDSDAEGTDLTVSLPAPNLLPVGSGTLSVLNGRFIQFTPTSGFVGTATFTYRICDQAPSVSSGCPALSPACSNATVSIDVVTMGNNQPTATFDMGTTTENTAVNLTVLSNDTDSDGALEAITVAVISAPTNGSTSVSPTGVVTYTPNTGFLGQDVFIYQVCDNGIPSSCDTAIVYVNVICPSIATPSVSSPVSNLCPATTVNLTSISSALTPSVSGDIFEWHESNSIGSALVSGATAVGAGTYYLFEKSTVNCYSAGAAVTVNINTCCPSPQCIPLQINKINTN